MIEVSNLSFKYPGQQEPVFTDFSLRLKSSNTRLLWPAYLKLMLFTSIIILDILMVLYFCFSVLLCYYTAKVVQNLFPSKLFGKKNKVLMHF